MPPRAPQAQVHLTVPELAERMGVEVPTVYGWNYTGTGPNYIRKGRRGRVLYPLDEVEAWEKRNLARPA